MCRSVRLYVSGDRACFTRPEFKAERVSYDILTPSAARGILEAIYWKPGVRWVIQRIHVLRHIRFQSCRRNEVDQKISVKRANGAMHSGLLAGLGLVVNQNREQRAAALLINVAYVIEARLLLTGAVGQVRKTRKHLGIFNRRARKGRCFHQPYLGTREFPAEFRLLDPDEPVPPTSLPADQVNRHLGWMLYDIDFACRHRSRLFRARLSNGVLDVQRCLAESQVVP